MRSGLFSFSFVVLWLPCLRLVLCQLKWKVHYRKLLLMQSLLTNMDCTSSGSELARTVSVPDAVIWISQAVK